MDYRNETFDIVNREDKIIKKDVLKSDLHTNDDITRIVTIYVITKDNQIIVAQRSPEKEVDPLKFEAPAHGRVNSGEDYDTAAHRETLEELGVHLSELIPIDKYYTSYDTNVGIRQHFKKLYIARTEEKIKFEEREILTLKYFDSFDTLFDFFENNNEVFSSAIALDMKKLRDFIKTN
jgi:8-oxo-dGTP pyrophosphatase MutT (NUDIX family)